MTNTDAENDAAAPSDAETGPTNMRPMLASDGKRPPTGEPWAFEIKWDGVRALAQTGGELWIVSRSGENVTARYPELAGLAAELGERRVVLDGEIVAFDGSGRPSFQLLQRRMGLTSPPTILARVAETPVTYMIFDLLALDGKPIIEGAYEERRRLLAELELAGPHWQTPAHHLGDGGQLLDAARRQGLEGVVSRVVRAATSRGAAAPTGSKRGSGVGRTSLSAARCEAKADAPAGSGRCSSVTGT